MQIQTGLFDGLLILNFVPKAYFGIFLSEAKNQPFLNFENFSPEGLFKFRTHGRSSHKIILFQKNTLLSLFQCRKLAFLNFRNWFVVWMDVWID